MAETSYIVAFLSDLVVRNDADAGANGPSGDLVLASACGTQGAAGRIIQKLHYPTFQWCEVLDGSNVLGWPYPGVGPALTTGRPWGIPVFALPEERMGETLALSLIGLESDSFTGRDTVTAALDVLKAVAGPLGTLVGGAAVGGVSGVAVGAITDAITASWEDDIIAVHTNTLSRADGWGVGRPPIASLDSQDGEWLIRYQVQRITIPYELQLRVRLNRIIVGKDLDPDGALLWSDDSDVFVVSRVWGGKFAGEIPEQQIHTYPEPGHYHDMEGGGPPWELNAVIFEGAVGPFLSVEIGVWDKDDTSEDDMHGMVFGLWLAPDLIRAFRANQWQPLRISAVHRGAPLTLDFQIEPLVPEEIWLFNWWSPSRGDHFTTTHPEWAESHPRSQRPPDYVSLGIQGRVFNPALPQPPGTVPLYSWWSQGRGDNFTTSDPRWAGTPGAHKEPGYVFHRLEGYVYDPALPQPRNTFPLHSWWSPSRRDNFATIDPHWAGKAGDRKAPDYGFNRLEGYVILEDLI